MTGRSAYLGRRRRRRRDSGSGTVLMLGVVCALLILTVAGLAVGAAVVASHRARAAVDLAALAGADVLLRGGGTGRACASASSVAASNGGRIAACSVSGDTVLVGVTVRPGVRGIGLATASARAGPSTPATSIQGAAAGAVPPRLSGGAGP